MGAGLIQGRAHHIGEPVSRDNSHVQMVPQTQNHGCNSLICVIDHKCDASREPLQTNMRFGPGQRLRPTCVTAVKTREFC